MASFTPKQRAAAVARAKSGKETKRQVAESVGVSETTLYRWINAAEESPGKVAHLRVASAEDARPQRLTLAQAIERGNYLEILLAQQRDIAASLPEASGPAKAALHRQFSLVTKEIEAIRSADTDDDDIGKAARTPDDEWDESAI